MFCGSHCMQTHVHQISPKLHHQRQLQYCTALSGLTIEAQASMTIYGQWSVLRPVSTAIYSVSQKKVAPPPKTFCIIFTQVKYISVKFCQHVVSSYLHIFANFGRFILIFNKMVLSFLGVPIVFNVFSFKFHQVKSP